MHNLNEELYEKRKKQIQPWLILNTKNESNEQKIIKELLRKKANAKIADNSYIASDANIFTSKFSLGENSWIASGAIIRGDVSIGPHCSVNPNAHIAGKVDIGTGCRIASLVSIYGFNHGHSRTDIYIKDQPSTSEGVYLGDDVWVGANAVILDGLKIGSHSIVAAGAVVTKSFPEYSIIAGNPAKRIKDRRKLPLAKFRLDDKNSGLRYHLDIKLNSYISCRDGFVIRGWILHPELIEIIANTQHSSHALSINKKRPDVVSTFFKTDEDKEVYINCGFEHSIEVSEIYSLYAKTSNELIHIADVVMEELVNDEK